MLPMVSETTDAQNTNPCASIFLSLYEYYTKLWPSSRVFNDPTWCMKCGLSLTCSELGVVHVQPRSLSTAGHKKDLARLTFYKIFFEGLPNYCLYHDSWAWKACRWILGSQHFSQTMMSGSLTCGYKTFAWCLFCKSARWSPSAAKKWRQRQHAASRGSRKRRPQQQILCQYWCPGCKICSLIV